MSSNSLYEITQMLYEILDRVTRIEKALYDDVEEYEEDADRVVKFSVVTDESETVIDFPTRD
jgi:hypothetical protein